MPSRASSPRSYRDNGCVKKALIETDRGLKLTVTLEDVRARQKIDAPRNDGYFFSPASCATLFQRAISLAM